MGDQSKINTWQFEASNMLWDFLFHPKNMKPWDCLTGIQVCSKEYSRILPQNHETTNKKWKHQVPMEWLYDNLKNNSTIVLIQYQDTNRDDSWRPSHDASPHGGSARRSPSNWPCRTNTPRRGTWSHGQDVGGKFGAILPWICLRRLKKYKIILIL